RGEKLKQLIKLIPGPDFPTGGYIVGRAGALQALTTGRGSILLRARTSIETNKKGDRISIIVTEIPYQVNKTKLLERIADLVREKILDELAELLKTIERLRAILASERLLMQIIVDELKAVREKYGDDRRTEIIDESGELSIEDLIAEEDMAITVSNTGYIKRTALSTYRHQRRRGKGRIGMRTRDED